MRPVASLLVSACLLLGACSVRPPVAVTPAVDPSAGIEALVRRGCYACLEAAFTAATAAGAHDAAFETALLLALRSKELGLPHAPWIARAREWLPEGPDWQHYLDIVLSVPADPLSGDRDELLQEAAASRRPRVLGAGTTAGVWCRVTDVVSKQTSGWSTT